MQAGIYELGVNTPIPGLRDLKRGFSVVIDTANRAINLRPFREEYVKRMIEDAETSLSRDPAWAKFSTEDKQKRIQEEKEQWQKEIAAGVKAFNDGKQIIWLVNNTIDTIFLQTKVFDLIAILEAKDQDGTWKPIEYSEPTLDNFQYGYKDIPPANASFFKAVLPVNGSFTTKLRYKLLGKDKFYYSPAFSGKIDHCQFTQDTAARERKFYTLDAFYNYVE